MDNRSDQSESSPSAPLPVSFKNIRLVTQEELTRRSEPVKTLQEDKTELYRVIKDTETGEHYLHYAVYHIHVAGGGAEEEYHHLLPLEHDDVIALALGAPLIEYPTQWDRSYLRNGPHGGFVWYDPNGAIEDETDYAKTEAFVREQLLAFREQGSRSEEDVKRLLDRMDKHLPPRTE
ncbi:hypothetical protein [Cohnella herbarum]|uniref:Uncharacterized protein n=1 Tax=Cohnella herbarum TaxID=2728023 RepID=A0A7Z2VGB9_9BACL|nr:hypothetical protein [Cohnella herbarum]QJD82569.1 hypothetical protein HH215_04765 [Cohnella herbarum]